MKLKFPPYSPVKELAASGTRVYRRLVHDFRCAVYAYYEQLLKGIENTNEDCRIANITYLAVEKAMNKITLDHFEARVEKFFPAPESCADNNIEELPPV
jgi:hypothetical protein